MHPHSPNMSWLNHLSCAFLYAMNQLSEDLLAYWLMKTNGSILSQFALSKQLFYPFFNDCPLTDENKKYMSNEKDIKWLEASGIIGQMEIAYKLWRSTVNVLNSPHVYLLPCAMYFAVSLLWCRSVLFIKPLTNGV